MILLDGPLGTELARRGVPTPAPAWSAAALDTAPDVIAAIHADYARAGCVVHTTCTFRTRPADAGDRWGELADRAVALARGAVPAGHRIAGSIGPLADCWHPERTPADPGPAHRALAERLARAGVDLLLVETFADPTEARLATAAAAGTGLPVWLSLTPGPAGDLLTPAALAAAAADGLAAGASTILVNCVAAELATPYVAALAGLGAPFGVYANAGPIGGPIGWDTAGELGIARYAALAESWVALGAGVIGGCCGVSPAHLAAIARRCGVRTGEPMRPSKEP